MVIVFPLTFYPFISTVTKPNAAHYDLRWICMNSHSFSLSYFSSHELGKKTPRHWRCQKPYLKTCSPYFLSKSLCDDQKFLFHSHPHKAHLQKYALMRLYLACGRTDRTSKSVLCYINLYDGGMVLSFLSETWRGALSLWEERKKRWRKSFGWCFRAKLLFHWTSQMIWFVHQ